MVTMDEQKTSNKNSGGGVLTYWVKAAPEASLQAVEAEVASLKKSVSDGKTLVAGAITGKGITTATDAAFATMADNINQISTLAADTADATATAAQILAGAKAYVKGSPVVGTMPNNGGPSTAIAAGSLKAGYTTGGIIDSLSGIVKVASYAAKKTSFTVNGSIIGCLFLPVAQNDYGTAIWVRGAFYGSTHNYGMEKIFSGVPTDVMPDDKRRAMSVKVNGSLLEITSLSESGGTIYIFYI